MKLAVAVIVVFMLLAAALVGSYALSLTAIRQSQHQWCDTLTLITANAKPSTEQGRVFYAKMHELEHRFGC